MKRNAIIRIVLYSIAIVLILSILATGIGLKYLSFDPFSGFSASDEGMPGGTQGAPTSIPADSVKKLEIQWVEGRVLVQTAETSEITFSESEDVPEENRMVWKQSGDTLTIQYSKSHASFSFSLFGFSGMYHKDLVVTVPKSWDCKALSIDSVSSGVTVSGLTVGSLKLENVSGSCDLTGCAAEKLKVETVSGSVKFAGAAETMEFTTVSADCYATVSGTPESIDLDSSSGDLFLTMPDVTGFTTTFDTMSGDSDISFPVTSSDKTFTYGDGSCRIQANTVSGDITIGK